MSKGHLCHVEIYVKDLVRSREFWEWFLGLLGYSIYQEWDEGFSMILDGTYIVFVQVLDNYKDITYHRCRVGLNHLAFKGGSREFVDELTNKLRKKGITILYEDKHPFAGGKDYYAVFFEDPDRIKVEVNANT